MARELRIDWIRCDGYGLCGDLAPDVIELDEWRYPIIAEAGIPPGKLNDVKRAADCCPMKALSIVEPPPGPRRLSIPLGPLSPRRR